MRNSVKENIKATERREEKAYKAAAKTEKAMGKGKGEFSYKIIRNIAVLLQGAAISKEVNVVQYGDAKPRLDIRIWKRKDGKEQLLKGVSFSDEEAVALEKAVHQYNQERAAHEGAL